MHEDPNQPMKLTQVRSEERAAVLLTALADRGIEAHMVGGFTSGFRAEAPGGVDVVVRQADLERALAILNELQPAEGRQRSSAPEQD
jgi:NADPH:quinone reductase-like Zn-dependent oxidoreductase